RDGRRRRSSSRSAAGRQPRRRGLGGGPRRRGAAGARCRGDGAAPHRLAGDRPGAGDGRGGMNAQKLLEILTWRDAVDILAVAVVVYNLLLLIRGTRAVQMLGGIVFVGLVYYAAQLAELPTLQKMLESLLLALPFAIIVLFQQEIRRALASFGRNPLWGLTKQQK